MSEFLFSFAYAAPDEFKFARSTQTIGLLADAEYLDAKTPEQALEMAEARILQLCYKAAEERMAFTALYLFWNGKPIANYLQDKTSRYLSPHYHGEKIDISSN